ncbi:MAG: glycosyltransferase family 39 protein [Burkholderiaceae bacterium]|jgi:4-amino-4-deoxy-L-arabinose transferase-like glycosyltransferase|nr:glycosyltransferase family 39 protein [Burkholderiaceae bacterium]MDO9259981.1 glycosyltransferase family 39 protein [Polaromonas sp.]
MKWLEPHSRVLWALLLGIVLWRLASLGLYPLMDTTEARYAEIARKMVEKGDWITPWYEPNKPFWGKPPLSFWLTAVSFHIFGINEWAARLPHLLAALTVGWLTWRLARRRSEYEALVSAVLLASSTLFFVAAGAVMTDMTLAVATTLAMRSFWICVSGNDAEKQWQRWLFFLAVGIGLLAKGPIAAVLIFAPVLLWTLHTGHVRHVWTTLPWAGGMLLALGIAAPWYYLAETATPGFLRYFLLGEHWQRFVTPGWQGDRYGTAHISPWGTIWWYAVVASLPWSLLAPVVAYQSWIARRSSDHENVRERRWRRYLLWWAVTPCLFFTLAGNILWTYVLPGLPALAIWAARYVVPRLPKRLRMHTWTLAMATAAPITFAAYVAYGQIGERFQLNSAKALVQEYQAIRGDRSPLLTYGFKSYSLTFYSGGAAQEVKELFQLTQYFGSKPVFLVAEEEVLARLRQNLKQDLPTLARYDRYWLVKIDPVGSSMETKRSGHEVEKVP